MLPRTSNRFDVLHVFYSNGVWGFELMEFLGAMKDCHDMSVADIRAWCVECNWQTSVSIQLKLGEVFGEARANSCKGSDHFKGPASELLGVYPLVRYFAETQVPDTNGMQPALDSLMVMTEVLDLIEEASKRPSKERISQIVIDLTFSSKVHHEAFIVAYGKAKVKPKHHLLLHIPQQIEEDEGVVSCWAQERKMGMARQACAHTSTMDNFEVGHLARMWNEQLRQLENPSWAKVLQGKILDCTELALALGTADAQVSSSMRWRHAILANGDMMRVDGNRMCLVVGCCQAGGDYYVLVRWGDLVSRPTSTSSTWTLRIEVVEQKLDASIRFVRASLWRFMAENSVMVLH